MHNEKQNKQKKAERKATDIMKSSCWMTQSTTTTTKITFYMTVYQVKHCYEEAFHGCENVIIKLPQLPAWLRRWSVEKRMSVILILYTNEEEIAIWPVL